MLKFLSILQITSALLLVASILIQQKGTGIGAAFGGENAIYRTRRGVEKAIFLATIIFAVLFFASIVVGFLFGPSL
ncbi:MAG: preprotein translocase subunit SecG [Patescibacteria group bacterium]